MSDSHDESLPARHNFGFGEPAAHGIDRFVIIEEDMAHDGRHGLILRHLGRVGTGYNQTLLKSAGDVVKSGEAISTVGDSGGQDTSALYFAIRQQGRPSDPTQWCRAQG